MKKGLLLLALCTSWLLFCSFDGDKNNAPVVKVKTAGTLRRVLSESGLTNSPSLTIVGKIDSADFATLRKLASSTLVEIDISAIDLKELPYAAFDGSSALKSIILPNSLTKIGSWTFYDCKALTLVAIPNRVTDVELTSFGHCYALDSIVVDKNNVNFKDIDGVLFSKDGKKLVCYPSGKKDSHYNIADSVVDIDTWAFGECPSLTSITLPNALKEIEGIELNSCEALTSIIVDKNNDNFKAVDGVLFSKDGQRLIYYPSCRRETNYIVASCVKEIDDFAFGGDSLTSISLPSSVTTIDGTTFSFCKSLNSIIVDKNNDTFKDVDGVLFSKDGKRLVCYPSDKKTTHYTVANEVKIIGSTTFRSCESLKSIILPVELTSIEIFAFMFCDSLQTVTCLAVKPPKLGDSAFDGLCRTVALKVPAQSVEAYKANTAWRDAFSAIEPL